jgi:general secretion pathway protein G
MKNKWRKSKKEQGFTLMELLVVVAVIAIILAILLPVSQTAFQKAGIHQAQSDISKVELALEGYKSKYGVYPSANPPERVPMDALDEFMKFPEKRVVGNDFNDPWGMPYYYESPGTHQTGFVDIVSAGPDQEMVSSNWSDDKNDDNIDNWSQKR